MKQRFELLAVAFVLIAFVAGAGCNGQAEQGVPADVRFSGTGGGVATSSPEVPDIARTDAELAALLREFEAGSKDREIQFYRRQAEFWAQRWQETVEAAVKIQSAMDEYRAASTQPEPARLEAHMKLLEARTHFRNATTWDTVGPTTWPEAEEWNRRRFLGIRQSAERLLVMQSPEIRFNGVPLHAALSFVGDVNGVQVVAQWPALKAAGVNPESDVQLHFKEGTIEQALRAILKQGDPATRAMIVPLDNVIVISTPKAADQTRKLLAESSAKSDQAGRDILNRLDEQPSSLAYGPMRSVADHLANRYKLRLVPDALALKDTWPEGLPRSMPRACRVGVFLRLFLDNIDDLDVKRPWTCRIVAGDLLIEPVQPDRAP